MVNEASFLNNEIISLSNQIQYAEVNISFWGRRSVTLDTGTVSFNSLYSKVNQIFSSFVYQGDRAQLSLDERAAALAVLKKINILERDFDDYQKISHAFTNFLILISRWLFGKPSIKFTGVNPFNEGKTILEKIRTNLDISDEHYSMQDALEDFGHYRGIIEHAIWEANGSIDFGYDRDYGGEILRSNPKGIEVKRALDLLLSFPSVDYYISTRALNVESGNWLK